MCGVCCVWCVCVCVCVLCVCVCVCGVLHDVTLKSPCVKHVTAVAETATWSICSRVQMTYFLRCRH